MASPVVGKQPLPAPVVDDPLAQPVVLLYRMRKDIHWASYADLDLHSPYATISCMTRCLDISRGTLLRSWEIYTIES